MRLKIRNAQTQDFALCRSFDSYNSDEVLNEKIERGYVLLGEFEGQVHAYLRWDWFWNRHPYLCLIEVQKEFRRKGLGTEFLNFWVSQVRDQGYSFCLSSAQKNEPLAVNWHLQNGFKEIGQIGTLNTDGSDEVFFRKDFS